MKNNKMMPVSIGVVAVLLVVLGVVIGISIVKQHEADKRPTQDFYVPTEEEYQYPKFGSDVETFVIMGVDSHENKLGAGTYSDSIMVVVINHEAKTIKVASLLRDCMVQIEGHGYEKLTHANYYGGPKLALQTIKENYDLNVSEYLQVNFANLVELVNAVGGVEINLTQVECEQLGIDRFTKPGKYLLNGEETLAYSRLRKNAGGDRARSERQRNVIFALFEKTRSMGADASIEIVEEMIDKINTSYREDEIVEIMYCMSRYAIADMNAFPQVYYDGLVDEVWYEVPTTLVDMNTALYEFLYDYKEYKPSDKAKEHSDAMNEMVDGPNVDYRN